MTINGKSISIFIPYILVVSSPFIAPLLFYALYGTSLFHYDAFNTSLNDELGYHHTLQMIRSWWHPETVLNKSEITDSYFYNQCIQNYNMMLDDKVCLITGSNRGIGRKITEKYLEEGAIVYGVARKEGSLSDLSEKYPSKFFPVYFDLRDKKLMKDAVMQINKQQGHIDVVVCNAGVRSHSILGMIPENELKETFEVNVYSVIDLIQYTSRLMKKQKKGNIIIISSVAGIYGAPDNIAYASSKGALVALTKSVSKDLSPYGIRCNSIAPGLVNTDMITDIERDYVGKPIDPDTIARVCTVMATDYFDTTGQIVEVETHISRPPQPHKNTD